MSLPDTNVAFNQGSEARLVGWPASANPYPHRRESQWLYWRMGWDHVNREWAELVHGRWPFRKLPKVGEDKPLGYILDLVDPEEDTREVSGGPQLGAAEPTPAAGQDGQPVAGILDPSLSTEGRA